MKVGFRTVVGGLAVVIFFIVGYSNWVEREFTLITEEAGHVAPATEPGEPIALPPVRSGGQTVPTKSCKLEFHKYVSSPWETAWSKNANKWSNTVETLCKQVQIDRERIEAWVQGAGHSQKGCGQLDPYFAEHNDTFSQFVYKDSCSGELHSTYIEPLAVLQRHPYAHCITDKPGYLVNRGYLVLGQGNDQCAATQGERAVATAKGLRPNYAKGGRTIVFDLGASYFSSGEGGASQVCMFIITYAEIVLNCKHAQCALIFV
jgi:hypothetical protein